MLRGVRTRSLTAKSAAGDERGKTRTVRRGSRGLTKTSAPSELGRCSLEVGDEEMSFSCAVSSESWASAGKDGKGSRDGGLLRAWSGLEFLLRKVLRERSEVARSRTPPMAATSKESGLEAGCEWLLARKYGIDDWPPANG